MFHFLSIIAALFLYVFPGILTQGLDKIFTTSDCSPLKESYYMVSLRRASDRYHVCFGSIIKPRWVLTAAYCFSTQIQPDTVIFALPNSFTRTAKWETPIHKHFVHERFDRSKMVNDIALVVLAGDLPLLDKAIFPKLASGKYGDDLSEICKPQTTINYVWDGFATNLDEPSPIGYCYHEPYVTNDKCPQFKYLDDNIMCTNTMIPIGSYCRFIMGSPLFCNGSIFGIVTYADGCIHYRAPKYYSRVDRFSDFISRTLKATDLAPSRQPRISTASYITIVTLLLLLHVSNFMYCN